MAESASSVERKSANTLSGSSVVAGFDEGIFVARYRDGEESVVDILFRLFCAPLVQTMRANSKAAMVRWRLVVVFECCVF